MAAAKVLLSAIVVAALCAVGCIVWRVVVMGVR